MDLADICRIVHPTRVMNTPTSVPRGTFFRRDQMQGHKTGLSNSQNTEAILNIFSDCSGIKPEVNKRLRRGEINWTKEGFSKYASY